MVPIARTDTVVIGIDVGGPSRGLHAVALEAGRYRSQFATTDINAMVHWCLHAQQATVIAIDAPCRWSVDGRGRPCERALMQQRIWCFATPKEEAAVAHPKGYFNWMRYGMDLYEALAATHPVRDARTSSGVPHCFETFPHAITWHLRGGNAYARKKRQQRQALLESHGISSPAITNIDTIDAALCAYTAHLAATGAPLAVFGEEATGFIVVPKLTLAPVRGPG